MTALLAIQELDDSYQQALERQGLEILANLRYLIVADGDGHPLNVGAGAPSAPELERLDDKQRAWLAATMRRAAAIIAGDEMVAIAKCPEHGLQAIATDHCLTCTGPVGSVLMVPAQP